jgi:hypothetical protein
MRGKKRRGPQSFFRFHMPGHALNIYFIMKKIVAHGKEGASSATKMYPVSGMHDGSSDSILSD